MTEQLGWRPAGPDEYQTPAGKLGRAVMETSSAAEALTAICAATHADLVISDQVMPHMTAVEPAAAIEIAWPASPLLS
jgi:CheY-like chemotaxis protein